MNHSIITIDTKYSDYRGLDNRIYLRNSFSISFKVSLKSNFMVLPMKGPVKAFVDWRVTTASLRTYRTERIE